MRDHLAPLGQNYIHIPDRSTGFDGQMSLLKVKCFSDQQMLQNIYQSGWFIFGKASVGFWTNRFQASFHEVKIYHSKRFIVTDKCFLNEVLCLREVVDHFTMFFLSIDGRSSSADI